MTQTTGLTGNIIGAFNRIGAEAKGDTPREILKNADMDFKVIKSPLYDHLGNELKSKYVRTARSDTGETLGVTSKSYTCFQPRQLIDLVGNMCQRSGTQIDRIGMVDRGSKMFMSFRMPEGYSFGTGSAEEQIDVYWYVLSSNDGSMGLKMIPSPVRLACSNQFAMLHAFLVAQGIDPKMLTIRHSSIMEGRIEQMMTNLNIIDNLVGQFATQGEELLRVEMSQGARIEYYIDVLGLNQNPDVMRGGDKYDPMNPYGLGTRASNTLDTLLELEMSESNTVGDMAGTAWGAFNTVTEFIDYEWTYNADGSSNDKRMESAVLGTAAKNKNRALQLLTV